ncbi:tyrosine-type recombinase/integrase [Nodosilinea sp. AN01ver1]|uniref:tyrosine-type recombinase/integrase n=1 Tax=Nodosilinea sp. AN01ver1 TaxID=3423362 RepID=UPI003D31448C
MGQLAQPESAIILRGDENAVIIRAFLRSHSANTRKAYQTDLSQFLDHIHQAPLGAVTLDDLQDYQDHLREQYPHPRFPDQLSRTARRKLASVKSLLRFAQETGAIRFNVGAALKLKRGNQSITGRLLSEEQVFKLFGAAKTPRDEAMLRLLYATGARVSEIASLTWGDVVEMPDGRAIINLYASKTDKSHGVTVSADLLHRLQSLSSTMSPDTPLLQSRQGNPLSDRRMREIVAVVAERAGVELPVSPHWFRHSHATHARNRGADMAIISKTLGHASLDTTMSMYTHLASDKSSGDFLAV